MIPLITHTKTYNKYYKNKAEHHYKYIQGTLHTL